MEKKKSSKKYVFVVEAPISLHVIVEAKSLQEAIQKAQDTPVMSLCHQCASNEEGEWRTSGEIDADPECCALLEVWEGDELLKDGKLKWEDILSDQLRKKVETSKSPGKSHKKR